MANYSFILPVNENTPISSFYGNRKNPFDKSSNIKNMHYGIIFVLNKLFSLCNQRGI